MKLSGRSWLSLFGATLLLVSGSARVVVKIKSLRGTTIATLRPGVKQVNAWFSYRLKVKATFKRGTYRYYVYATDAVGNVQTTVAHNSLVVY